MGETSEQALRVDFDSSVKLEFHLTALLRQAVYSRLAGYEDTNDAGRLSADPAMRQIVGERALYRQAASAS